MRRRQIISLVGVPAAIALLLCTNLMGKDRSTATATSAVPHVNRFLQNVSETSVDTSNNRSMDAGYATAEPEPSLLVNVPWAERDGNRRQNKTLQTHKEDTCTPSTHVAFLKTHKCSSSTVQNILFRYGEEHKLNFVLPPKGHYLSRGPFSKGSMMKFPVKEYNILCQHTIFSAQGMAEVMPRDTIYVTILRDPVPMFESVFSYLNMAKFYQLPEGSAMEGFFKKPEYFYKKRNGGAIHMKNPMLYDLGVPEASLSNEAAITEKIAEIQQHFDLVMMTEYFEESLILLKELMCWDLDDVIFFVLNARTKSDVRPLSPQLASQIRKWNHGDVELYDTFNRTFWQKVETFGLDRMKQEVDKLRQRIQYFTQRCISGVDQGDPKVWHPKNVKIESFKLRESAVNDTICVRLIRTELPYTHHLRKLQKARFAL